jgi:hypothetical protein
MNKRPISSQNPASVSHIIRNAQSQKKDVRPRTSMAAHQPTWKLRRRPISRDCVACGRDFPTWLMRKPIPEQKRAEALQMWEHLPRRSGRPIIPSLKPKEEPKYSALDGSFGDIYLITPELAALLLQWIQALKGESYIVEVLNSTELPIAVVWTYLLNELTPDGDIITVGPYSSTWLGLTPGQIAVFELSGCLYMKSYAISVVYDGEGQVVLPNTSIAAINQYEKDKFGSTSICTDWWEIYI